MFNIAVQETQETAPVGISISNVHPSVCFEIPVEQNLEMTLDVRTRGASIEISNDANTDIGIELQIDHAPSGGGEYPFYNGEYTVTPAPRSQVLETSRKVMRNNVVVQGIPYYEVSNLSGGYTANIGG